VQINLAARLCMDVCLRPHRGSAAVQRRQTLALLAAKMLTGAAPGVIAPASAWAQAAPYPSRAVRLIVPFTPGGSTDILARAIAQELTRAWGQPVLVDNIAGAGGAIGAERVAKASPDGYTLLMGHIGTLAVNPSLYPRLPYDPVKDFAPVAFAARVPNVLAVHPSVPVRTLRELLTLARARPGQINYGSGGNGSAANLATETLKLQANVPMVHIPYRGTAPAVNDLLAGQIQVLFSGIPALLPHIKSGALRALAVSSPVRLEVLPEVPTVAEAGAAFDPKLKDFEADQWYGVVAPASTPRELVTRLNAQINAALQAADVKARLQTEGALPMPQSPEAFGTLIRQEIVRWRPVIQSGRVKAD
jgi:tripartite-type tricarboxylate transporter receptor subunit TctC